MEHSRHNSFDAFLKDARGQYFITGIDTDAGKSYATGWLARELCRAGNDTTTMKFVQTGNRDFSEDIAVHRRIMGIANTNSDLLHITAPEIFSYPCSPELAARIDGRPIDFHLITSAADELAREHRTLLIEGAGGLMVPLKGDYLTSDYVREHNLPLILVTNSRLGSINHTLLALYAIKHLGLELAGVVYNSYFDKDKTISDDTRQYIQHWLSTHFPTAWYAEMPSL